MNKSLWLLLVAILVLVGCSNNNSVNSQEKEETSHSEESQQTEVEEIGEPKEEETKKVEPKVTVDKIILAMPQETFKGLVAYQDFEIEIIETIGKNNNIPIEVKEITNFEDSLIALEEGAVDVMAGADRITEPNLDTTYSYLSSPLYFPNGVEVSRHSSYRMVVHKDSDELRKLLNREISAMKDNGTLEKIQNKHLGERENKEHIILEDMADWDRLKAMSQQERDNEQAELDKYMEMKE